MIRSWFIHFLLLMISYTSFSQENKDNGGEILTLGASYIGENVNNLSGGIETGSCYLGMANVNVSLNTRLARLWKNGLFFLNASNTHGAEPSALLIGDYQVASNIEAGNHTFIQELWYRQAFGRLEITAGLQDLNIEFAKSEQAGHFLNSSFGILPTISCNVPAPVFPLTSLGLSLKCQLSEKTAVAAAIYDGCPTAFEENPFNLKWEFNSGDGTLVVTEFQRSTGDNDKPGTFKTGIYFHHHFRKTGNEPAESEFQYKTNYGIYAIADRVIWKGSKNNRKAGLFLQLGLCPEKQNLNYYYTGIGLNYYGLMKNNGEDVIGISVAHAGLTGNTGDETTVEFTCKIPFTEHCYLQPDIQYIINPAGTATNVDNSLVASIRFGISF